MERKLTIRNFGAITSADIVLKDLNIFIGEQGAGKSTVAKLITLFENYENQPSEKESDSLMTKFAEFNIISYFNPDSYINYTSGKGSITYEEGSFRFNLLTNPVNHNLYIPAERFFISTFSRSCLLYTSDAADE